MPTRSQAEAVVALVRNSFRSYVEPMKIDRVTYPPECPEPTLVKREHGDWEIQWEDGPSEWAYVFSMGGVSDEDVALANEVGLKAREVQPVLPPRGVWFEPVCGHVLGVYEA